MTYALRSSWKMIEKGHFFFFFFLKSGSKIKAGNLCDKTCDQGPRPRNSESGSTVAQRWRSPSG